MRSNLPPEELELGQALERIFPGYCWTDAEPPKRIWRAGQKPDYDYHSSNLDNVIEALIKERLLQKISLPRLKGKDDLEVLGISCPYYYARLAVAFCAENAKRSIKQYADRKGVEAEYQRDLSDDARVLASHIEKFIDKHRAGEIALRASITSPYAQPVRSEHIYERLKRTEALIKILHQGQKGLCEIDQEAQSERRRYVKQGARDVWRLSFVSGIERLWAELVSEMYASSSKAFTDFLTASYNLIGGEHEEWKRSIRTAAKVSLPKDILDHQTLTVPDEILLLSELSNNEDVSVESSAIIRACLTGLDGAEQIENLLGDDHLPRALTSIVQRMPWSLEEQLSRWQGVPLPLVRDFLRRVNSGEA